MCNRLKVNVTKTKFILFKQKNKSVQIPRIQINRINIEQVVNIRYLGLILDENLNWKEHLHHVITKLSPMISAVYRARQFLTKGSKFNVYNAYFLSNFRYLIPVWGTCGIVAFQNMQILQNKVLKVLFNYDRLTHTEALYRELSVYP